MIHKYTEKVKAFYEDRSQDIFVAVVIFLVGLGSFGLGRLSRDIPEKQPLVIENPATGGLDKAKDTATGGDRVSEGPLAAQKQVSASRGKYVASKNGTAYHYPWCPGAAKIKEENKIWFQTKEEAEAKGYKPAGNCDGL